MSPSSIFSFRTLRARWRRLSLLVAATLFMLVLFDGLWRIFRPINTANGWLHRNLAGKMDGIVAHAGERRHIDYVLIGTSAGKCVDVDQWPLAAGGRVTAYNASVPGLRSQQVYYALKGHILRNISIGHLIHVINPQDVSFHGGLQYWEYRQHGQYFDSWRFRAFAAESLFDHVKSFANSITALGQDRKVIRAWLEGKLTVTDREWYRTEGGMAAPSIQRLPRQIPETYLSWTRAFPGANALHDYRIAWEGDIRMIRQIVDLCRQHGTSYTLASYHWSKWGRSLYNDPERDHALFTGLIDQLRSEGFNIVDFDTDSGLGDSFFEDAWHDNRWGSEIITRRIFEEVIAPEIGGTTDTTRLSRVIHLIDRVDTSTTGGLFSAVDPPRLDPVYNRYEAPRLVRAEAGARITVVPQAAPGFWTVDIYGGDVRGSKDIPPDAHLRLIGANDRPGESTRTTRWGKTLQGHDFTRLRIRQETTGPLAIEVLDAPMLLDSAFVYAFP